MGDSIRLHISGDYIFDNNDNISPEYKDKDLMGRIFVKLYFGALFSKISNEFKDVNIKNVNIGGDKIEGSLMGTPVTLTRID